MVYPQAITLSSNYNYILEKYFGTYENALGIILSKILGYKIIDKASFYARKKC